MKKTGKLNLFICLSAFVLLIVFVLYFSDKGAILDGLLAIRPLWIAAAVGCMLLYWLIEALILHLMLRPHYPAQRFIDTVRVSMCGQYFNCVTPMATGGQPFQAYYLTKQKVPLGIAMNGLLSKFIVYQTVLVIVSAVLLVLRLDYFVRNVSGFAFLVFIGFLVNALVMVALLSLAIFEKLPKTISRAVIGLLGKVKLIKDPEKKKAEMDEQIDGFRAAFREMPKHLPEVAASVVLTVVQLLSFMIIPYLICRSFGPAPTDVLTMTAAQSFVMTVSSFIPIPGAEGGAEGSFLFFFGGFFAAERIGLALVIWRVITFWLMVIVGGGFALSCEKRYGEKSQ